MIKNWGFCISSFNKIKFVLVGGYFKTKYKLNVFNNIASLDFKYKHNRRTVFIGKFAVLFSQYYKTKQEETTSSDQKRFLYYLVRLKLDGKTSGLTHQGKNYKAQPSTLKRRMKKVKNKKSL